METPMWSDIPKWMFEYVYEPSEDSFLFLDALEMDMDLIRMLKPLTCIEVGCGSGVVISAVSKLLRNSAWFLGTDINELAAKATKLTAKQNGIEVETAVTDLVECFSDRLHGKIDLILFNPPYVVTPSNEVGSRKLSSSWAGGMKGREVIDRFLPKAAQLLSETGLFYMVIIKENDYDDIVEIMKKHKLETSVVLSRRSGCEHLSVLRFSRKDFSQALQHS